MMRRGARELWKLAPITAVIAAVILVLGGMFAALYSERLYARQKLEDVDVQARILAEAVTAPLEFLDPATTAEYTEALQANTDIEAAGVYDAQGMLTAGFARPGAAPLPAAVSVGSAYLADNRIIAVAPVGPSDAPVGAVYLRAVSAPLAGQLVRYGVIVGFVLMAVSVLAVLSVGHAALRAADAQLRDRARALEASNRERERAEETLRQVQKMEAVGQLTGGVAHDFNNLLAVVTSGLRLLTDEPSAEKRAMLIASMRQSVDRGARLTRQLLAFARREPLNPEVIRPGALIEGMRELLQQSLREDIRVDIDMPADLWLIEADSSALEMAILNLAVNARDAMPNGGVISIKGENVAGAEESGGDAIRLTVSDTGQGMPEEIARRAFEPFYTTKEVGKGTGMGLSQVYGFARQSEGSVAIESAAGEGTSVILTLPRCAGAAAADDASLESAVFEPVEPGAAARVLMVEDDDMVAAMVAPLIERLGHTCERVANASEALEKVSADDRYDIVFSDIVMPGGMNGLELARTLRRTKPDLSIVLTTGYSGVVELADSEFPVLRKPYQPEELADALAKQPLRRRD